MATKYKMIYDNKTNSIIDVVPYDNAVSDKKGQEYVSNLNSKLEAITKDVIGSLNDIPNSDAKATLISHLQTLKSGLENLLSDISNHSANTYTKQDMVITTVSRGKAIFDAFNIDYSGDEILNPPE